MKTLSWHSISLGFAALLLVSPVTHAEPLSAKEAATIAREAYIYLYPLVTMDLTRRQQTNVPLYTRAGRNPPNVFAHIRTFPSADWKVIVRPNFDTLYSFAWLDLTREPVIVSAPDTNGRYYLLAMLDMWSDVFAAPGKRTTGTQAGRFAIVPPHWEGELPPDVTRIDAPTPYVWVIGRTQTNGPEDYAAVNRVQDGYSIAPLSQLGKPFAPSNIAIDPKIDMRTPPLAQVNAMSASQFFTYAAELLKSNPPHLTDWSILARMKRIGLECGKSFDEAQLDPAIRKALQDSPAAAMKVMREKIPSLARVSNGWQMNTDTMGVYGNYYLKRAIVALIALGSNQPEEAIYPLNVADADGNPLRGENKYVMHFEPSELPPVDAFWSLTMYDASGFQVANAINRYAIGDRDKLKFNADGSLDLYIQHDHPGPDKASNWLPAPKKGLLSLTMRLYAPAPQVADGRWNPPPVKLVREWAGH